MGRIKEEAQFRTLRFESLEDRNIPAVLSAAVASGVLSIKANDANDNIKVTQVGTQITVTDLATSGSPHWNFTSTSILNIKIWGKGGDDKIISDSPIPTIVYGDGGNDYIQTGAGADTIWGSSGNDTLRGGAGNDSIDGEFGDDKIYGMDGIDQILGGYGSDFLDGGGGANFIDGGKDKDFNADQWAVNGATYIDAQQSSINTCVFLASLSASAYSGVDLASKIKYLGEGNYEVNLFIANLWQKVTVQFDGTIDPVKDPGYTDEGESWVIIYQRAYLKAVPDYQNERAALSAVTGKITNSLTTKSGPFTDADFTALATATTAHKAVTAGSNSTSSSAADHKIIVNHMYTVIGTSTVSGVKYVTLRNPWGKSDPNANNGIITISWTNFKNSFEIYHIA